MEQEAAIEEPAASLSQAIATETQVAPDDCAAAALAAVDAKEVEDIPRFGDGYMRLSCGGYYKGQFKFSNRHGSGVLVSFVTQEGTGQKGEDRYEGQFANGTMQGRGRRCWPNGTSYDGEWQKGRKHGQGILAEAEGREYRGQFAEGLRHGKGAQTFNRETCYDGGWQRGQQHGTGVYTDSSKGIRYEGKWHYGARSGPGMHRSMHGAERETQSYTQGRLTTSDRLPTPSEYLPVRPATVAL
mmetsp:Transcript_40199/g.92404  ORF Transcript_40199/g.92404 Transcript_40199/m.92404 type:complete len:242 (-) Transcript_40199:70-795(-)